MCVEKIAFSFISITGLNSAQINLYTSKDFRPFVKQSLLENKSPILKRKKTKFILEILQKNVINFATLTFFLVLLEN